MSLLDRIAECRTANADAYVPFTVEGERVGWIDRRLLPRLAAEPGTFRVDERGVALVPALCGRAERGAAVNAALRRLYDRDRVGFGRWCGEPAPVQVNSGGRPSLFEIERAALGFLGVAGRGVHLNGYVEGPDGKALWVARRSHHIAGDPGKLDQIAAGFLPARVGPRDALREEAWIEAGIPPELAARAIPAGAVGFCRDGNPGLVRGAVLVFDLELPADFMPVNRDGEVEAFELWPLDRVESVLAESQAFKFDCALVAIDFLVRHGHFDPDRDDYLAIVRGLHGGDLPSRDHAAG